KGGGGARRFTEVLDRLSETLTEEERELRLYDVVRTDELVIHGRVEGPTLKVKSSYFGEAQVALADLRTLRLLAGGSEKELALNAAQYGVPAMVWLDTGVEVNRGDLLVIQATGVVDLYPIGAELGMYKASPAGSRQWGVQAADGQAPGSLVGRIGQKGRPFVIGEKYEGRPGEAGKLYLRVGVSPWNNVPAGEYRIKIARR